jgi:hypothetical protein
VRRFFSEEFLAEPLLPQAPEIFLMRLSHDKTMLLVVTLLPVALFAVDALGDSSSPPKTTVVSPEGHRVTLVVGAVRHMPLSQSPSAAGNSEQTNVLEYGRLVRGRVQAVDPAARLLVIADTAIPLPVNTEFDSRIQGGLNGIEVGDRIEVHGIANAAAGTAMVTRIAKGNVLHSNVQDDLL